MIKVISSVLYDAMIHGKEQRVHAINMKPKTENWTEQQLRTEVHGKDYSFVLWDDEQGVYKLKRCSHKRIFPSTFAGLYDPILSHEGDKTGSDEDIEL